MNLVVLIKMITEHDKELIIIVIVMCLWTILTITSNALIGLIGLAIAYRRLVKNLDKTKKETGLGE